MLSAMAVERRRCSPDLAGRRDIWRHVVGLQGTGDNYVALQSRHYAELINYSKQPFTFDVISCEPAMRQEVIKF